MSELFARRAEETRRRMAALQGELSRTEVQVAAKACVYATGSFGRVEAARFSDLDLFIAGKVFENDGSQKAALSRLDVIELKADLIRATRKLGIPEFSGDGAYLQHYTVQELVKTLGHPEDDSRNTFTARLLLLLESRPLIGSEVYKEITKEVIRAYWRDYDDHSGCFMPAYLTNDILRLWRTFCVNYEARTSSDPPEKKAKRKLKNYKLKHSRLLTCYSALLYLLEVYVDCGTVCPEEAELMIRTTPADRIRWLRDRHKESEIEKHCDSLLRLYERFLEETEYSEEALVERFMNKEAAARYMTSAGEFGNEVFHLLRKTGGESAFYRMLLV